MQNLAENLYPHADSAMSPKSIAEIVTSLLPTISERAGGHDRDETFVADN